MMKWTLALLSIVIFNTSSASKVYRCMPKNNLEIPVLEEKSFIMKFVEDEGVGELDFYQVIETFEAFWKPIIEQKYQKKLIIQAEWQSAKVDAYATRDNDNNPVIVLQGGLARHKDMTPNGLLLILCHELGHHYGGAPKAFRGRSQKRSWSSAEGQADYFASNKCMSKMIDANLTYKSNWVLTDKSHEASCNDKYCTKVLPAALSVGKLFASLKQDWREPSIKARSRYKVYSTFYKHPDPQCRFDTFLAGSLCQSEFERDFDNEDYRIGACVNEENPQAARPSCWFAPADY